MKTIRGTPRPRPLRIGLASGPTDAYRLGARDAARDIARRLRKTDMCIDCLARALAAARIR
jgi:hypothetical protein